MIIPYQSLPAETLISIIEAFVLKEGTEYGAEDVNLEEKIEQVKQQLIKEEAVIVYSELHQTVNILPSDQFNNNQFIEQ